MTGITTSDKNQTTFPASSIKSLQNGKSLKSSSAQIIDSMAKMTGLSIETSARVMDEFWGYVSNHSGNWRKDTHCLQIPKFGTFILKPRSKTFIQKQKVGKMKFFKSQFIYRDKEGKWRKSEAAKARINFSLSPSINLESLPSPPFDPPSTQWIENWTGKGHSRLSSKRRISVSIHEKTGIPLKEVHVLLNCLFLATLSAIKSQEKVNFAKRGTFIKKNRVNFKATPSFERKFGLIE
jgi:nucleoid DNA-binding protein